MRSKQIWNLILHRENKIQDIWSAFCNAFYSTKNWQPKIWFIQHVSIWSLQNNLEFTLFWCFPIISYLMKSFTNSLLKHAQWLLHLHTDKLPSSINFSLSLKPPIVMMFMLFSLVIMQLFWKAKELNEMNGHF